MKRKQSEFYRLRHSVGLGRQEDATNFLEISKTTLRRWDKEDSPNWAKRLMRHRDRWDCAAHGPEWNGWKFSRGRLVNAKAKIIMTPERLRLWPGVCDQLERYERDASRRRECPVMRIVRIVRIVQKMVGWRARTQPHAEEKRQ